MSYPHQPWQPQGAPGQPQVHYPNAATGNTGYPQYGGMSAPPRLNFNAVDQTKVAAAGVVGCALLVLVGSLFSLYSVVVTPSNAIIDDNDAPAGSVEVGIGFFDVAPFPAPVVAAAIPTLMLLAALSAAPTILNRAPRPSGLPAVFAGTAALLAIVLAISNPLPTVDLNGELAAELADEVGGLTIGQLIDSVVSVSPGAGLIVAALFAVIGWAAAVMLLLRRTPPGAASPPAPGSPPSNSYAPPPPNSPPRW